MTILSVLNQVKGVTCFETHSEPDNECQSHIDTGLTMHTWASSIHLAMSFLDPFYSLPGAF
eukprot:14985493-Heterocapsa_arctica.AAC.1